MTNDLEPEREESAIFQGRRSLEKTIYQNRSLKNSFSGAVANFRILLEPEAPSRLTFCLLPFGRLYIPDLGAKVKVKSFVLPKC